jgi:hypothetical protein
VLVTVLEDVGQDVVVQVFTVGGRCLVTQRLSGTKGTYSLGEFKTGIYFARASGGCSAKGKVFVVR